jgi:hypothetical protein
MKLITIDDLKTLIEKQKGLGISIYMPTHRAKPETQQDPIRFKNLLAEAERQLLANGLRALQVRKLLKPAQGLLSNRPFWQYQSDGLALFLSAKVFRYYRLPLNFRELVVVTDRFHTKPLLPLFSGSERFYVLALSQNEVKLFEGSRYNISEVELEGVPKSMEEALIYDDHEKQLQLHPGTPRRVGKRGAMFHGKENLRRYFRLIDKGLHQLLKREGAPLVLAGVDYFFSIYREANTYPYLLDSGIAGSPDKRSAEELHEQAWLMVKPLLLKAQKEAAARYKQLMTTKRASHELKTIVPAAYHGRIEFLFVAVGTQRWGTFDPRSNVVHLHQKTKPGDGDLLDFVSVHALFNGGTVYAVEPKKVPGDAPLAAVFRY